MIVKSPYRYKKEVIRLDDFFFMPYKTIEAGHDT